MSRGGRKHYSSEEKIWIVLDGLRAEDSIAEPCRREGYPRASITSGLKTSWRPVRSGWLGTPRAANTDEVKELHRETKDLEEVVTEQTLELRLLKKSMYDGGGDHE